MREISPAAMHSPAGESLQDAYHRVRAQTEALCEPLAPEDFVVQSMPDVSPTKWHLAHTSWFFETFVIQPCDDAYTPFHPAYGYLFNSYYNTVGAQYPRPQRGLLTRPTVADVFAYRAHVNRLMDGILEAGVDDAAAELITLGLHHEQQHQELLLTDIKHVFSMNPLYPAYAPNGHGGRDGGSARGWRSFDGGLVDIGHDGDGFAFDNEGPRHKAYVEAFDMDARTITEGEYREFIDDGGYTTPSLWLSDGWALVKDNHWDAPLYWTRRDGEWRVFTLSGLRPLSPAAPVCHVSYYEADAFARWAGARLPREDEWEVAARSVESNDAAYGTFMDDGAYHPQPDVNGQGYGLRRMFGDVWEWTQSAYAAYPGYTPPQGAIGEYNGKFMSNQVVLRGGSCATPRSHIRPTYRNFFYPPDRWQFTGVRLARDA